MEAIIEKEKLEALASRLDVPSRESEIWRKVPLDGLDLKGYDFAAAQSKLTIKASEADALTIFPLTNGNDLSDIPAQYQSFLNQQIRSQEQSATNEQDLFLLQNLLKSRENYFVVVNDTKSKDTTLGVTFRHQRIKGEVYMARVYVLVEEGVQCEITEEFTEVDFHPKNGSSHLNLQQEKVFYYNTYSSISCQQRAKVDYLCVRNYNHDMYYMQRFQFNMEEKSQIKACYAHVGGFVGKSYINVNCTGRFSDFRCLGAGVHSGREFHDFEVLVENKASNVSSILIYKMVLRDRAHSVFNGNLNIPQGFKKVRSLQTNHNILLDREARAESMPRLIIASDDVSCDHGATVGQLSEEALFYLMSRGLTREQAYYLMVEGFLNAIIEEFPLVGRHTELMNLFRNKIGGLATVDARP